MKCTNPILIKNGKIILSKAPPDLCIPKGAFLVPCGVCMSCRIARSKEWSVRIMHEMTDWNESSFVTLTYSDDCLPEYASLNKVALQKFLKRLRKKVEKVIRYYACGEYGETTERPHYHLILFGYRPDDLVLYKKTEFGPLFISSELRELWPYGNNTVGDVSRMSARYVAEYVNKKVLGKESDEYYGEREKPFSLMSKGIGLSWAEENSENLKKNSI